MYVTTKSQNSKEEMTVSLTPERLPPYKVIIMQKDVAPMIPTLLHKRMIISAMPCSIFVHWENAPTNAGEYYFDRKNAASPLQKLEISKSKDLKKWRDLEWHEALFVSEIALTAAQKRIPLLLYPQRFSRGGYVMVLDGEYSEDFTARVAKLVPKQSQIRTETLNQLLALSDDVTAVAATSSNYIANTLRGEVLERLQRLIRDVKGNKID